jgi:HEAT repeat protein
VDDNKVYVAALNPISALAVIKNEELKDIALEVSEKLKRVIDRIAMSQWVGFYEIDPAIQNLITSLSSSDEILRIHSRESLVKIGKPAVPQLVEALIHGSHWLRWEAAKTLGEIGDPAAAPALVKALKDEEFDVQWLAAEGLIKMKTGGIESLLHALMAEADLPRIREGAHHVIRELIRGELREYLTPVLSAIEGVEPSIQVPWVAKAAHEKLTEAGIFRSHYKPIPKNKEN